ncbi:Butirosin biosynthesis, BtrG-like protein [Ostreococcus tauri]|uniref:Gamma-glutamylcyclotransferase family protein n=1 Tax=Ostreococcus tauri TaxID=70448 RepID=A0A1Y5IE47_OSTTA|nr:Butirosin biosynthesis, BtrG-like protein [Ostreococcus tauri]
MSPATFAPGVHRVFVYGTLKRDLWNHKILRNGASKYVADVKTRRADFKMFLAEAGYPYLTMVELDGRIVHGELYEVNDQTLEMLDALEEISSGLYSREELECVTVDEAATPYDAYFFLAGPRIDVSNLSEIETYDKALHDERYVPKDKPRIEVDRW